MADEDQDDKAQPAQNPNGQAAVQADDPTELTFEQWKEKAYAEISPCISCSHSVLGKEQTFSEAG
jgi:hypothetical protein